MSYTCHVNIGLEKQIFCFMLLIVAVLGYVQHSWFSDVKDGSFGVMNIIRTVRDLPPLTSTITIESSYPDQTSPSPSQHNTTSTSCQTIKRSNRKLPLVALAAAGGAGSTWAKHLLQQATGIYSGSIHEDRNMKNNDEFRYKFVYDGSVTPIKTHKPAYRYLAGNKDYQKAILMLRDPYSSIKANFNRLTGGKTGTVTTENFDKSRWLKIVHQHSVRWITQVVSWLVDKRPLFIMKYDDLKYNLTSTLQQVVTFLELNTTSSILKCTLDNTEGSYHRPKSNETDKLLIFPEKESKTLGRYKQIVDWHLQNRCPNPPWCLPLSTLIFKGPYSKDSVVHAVYRQVREKNNIGKL